MKESHDDYQTWARLPKCADVEKLYSLTGGNVEKLYSLTGGNPGSILIHFEFIQ